MFKKMKIKKAMAKQGHEINGKLTWLSTCGSGVYKIVNYLDSANTVYTIHADGRVAVMDMDSQLQHSRTARF